MTIFWPGRRFSWLIDSPPLGRGPNKFRPEATYFASALEIFEVAIVCFPVQRGPPRFGWGALRVGHPPN